LGRSACVTGGGSYIEDGRGVGPAQWSLRVFLNGLVVPIERASGKTLRLALRWMLILATALLLFPPGTGARPHLFATLLLVAFVASNAVLTVLPEARFRARNLEYLVVIADTFLVSLALFQAGLSASHLPLVFFLTLLLAVLGADLPRTIVGITLVSGLYLYLLWRGAPGHGLDLGSFLMRLPFLYVTGLYYGHLVHQARVEQEQARRVEREKQELQTFLEVTSATTSTLDLHEVLFVIVRRIAALVSALRCSILTVDEKEGRCRVLASSDDPTVNGLSLDLQRYPEVRKAFSTRQAVVINDVAREPLLDTVRHKLQELGYHSIMVIPLVYRETLLGMLFLRAARAERRFSSSEIAACQVIANASANALRNAMLFEEMRTEARSRQKTAEQLQSILDHSPDLIVSTDMQGRLTEFSRGGQTLLGWARTEALAMSVTDLYPEGPSRERLERLLQQGTPIRNFETVIKARDGSLRDVMVTATLLRDEAGDPIGTVGIIKNVSDLKAAQRHLVQAEKLSAVGEVVSGVAHELNNPLAGVLGYAQLLMAGPMEGRQQRSVERIFESALRCQKIVQNLLAFARRHPSEKRHLGLNGIIDKTLDLKAYQLRVNNLRVEKRLDPALPKSMLDFNQIQQVLLNVINNAQHAIGRGRGEGTLSVSTGLRDGMILLEIRDDGPGIATDVLGKIFDPFFTTKPVGEGTGLGLSVSYGIIKDHGGRIWAESAPGNGTAIFIELPIVEVEEAPGPEGVVSPSAPAPLRALNILAVDDEAVILDLVVDALGRDGHRVDTASSGREALQKLERGSYDIVLLDLKMPEMDGHQLFDAIRERWPAVSRRVIFASGDTIHPDTRRFIDASTRPCLDKPFKLEALVSMIGTVAEQQPDAQRRSSGTA
jgi:PAS domain S-box-containing protein